jgi:hypothetical protein
MPNPIKIVKALTKTGNKAMRGKKKSKGFKTPNAKGTSQVTSGLYKAGNLAGKAVNVPAQGNKQGLKGSVKNLKKAIDKTTSKRDPIQKHPLVRNTGEASAEGKYRYARKSVAVKKKGK